MLKFEIVNKYEYLGVYVDDALSYSENIHYLYRKCIQRIHYLRLLNSLKIDREIHYLRLLNSLKIDMEIMSLFYTWLTVSFCGMAPLMTKTVKTG